MPSIVVDSGPLIAVFDRDDRHHDAALQFFRSSQATLVTNIAVITEVTQLLDFSDQAVRDFLGWVEACDIDTATAGDLPRIVAIMAEYDDLPTDFADASLVALCERRDIRKIATLDSDFQVYRIGGRKPFVNVFDRG